MCGRYVITSPASALSELFEFNERPNIAPRFYMAPTQSAPVILASPQSDHGDRVRQCQTMRWGLIPSWSKEIPTSAPLINARAETITEKPSFRGAFQRRRCLVPADGFYEWERAGNPKQPYLIGLKGFAPFAMAGIWESWVPEQHVHTNASPVASGKKELRSFSLLTTDANSMISTIHHRMPVILRPEHWETWLSQTSPTPTILDVLKPYSSEEMEMHPVDPRVGNVSQDDEGLLSRYTPPTPTAPAQGSLF